jgi:hypothetical protein
MALALPILISYKGATQHKPESVDQCINLFGKNISTSTPAVVISVASSFGGPGGNRVKLASFNHAQLR